MLIQASLLLALVGGNGSPGAQTWAIEADYIEACSCSLFCSCYFNTEPEGGMFCEFNNAIRLTKAHVGSVKLDGKYVWLSGDLGGDFKTGSMKAGIITFDTGTTKAQKTAMKFLMGKIYPVKWGSFVEDEAKITWRKTGMNGYAKLGNKAEVTLTGVKGADGKQSMMSNVPYWGAQKNTGFYLAYGTHWYKGNGYDYSHKKRNGFMIHIGSAGKM